MKRSFNSVGKTSNKFVKAVALGAILLGTSIAQVQARTDVSNMTCGAAKSLIKSEKRITISLGGSTYDSVVGSRFMCIGSGGGAERIYVKTADVRSCGVGYRCFHKQGEDKQPEDKPEKTPNTPGTPGTDTGPF